MTLSAATGATDAIAQRAAEQLREHGYAAEAEGTTVTSEAASQHLILFALWVATIEIQAQESRR